MVNDLKVTLGNLNKNIKRNAADVSKNQLDNVDKMLHNEIRFHNEIIEYS